jgi:thioesterase domain-containing protein
MSLSTDGLMVDEINRLRAENEDLRRKLEDSQRERAAEHEALVAQSQHAFREHEAARGEAQRTVYVAADTPKDAVMSAPWWPTAEIASRVKGIVGDHIYAVTLTARKVK